MFRVSVIIPVYNTEKYLVDCLESVIHQTLQELEIILINDGSTDGSLKIMESYQEKYADRIQVLSKENGGQATARNLAMPLCHGEYIGFVDSDDYIEPQMYEKMYQMAKETDADYVECNYVNVKVNQNGEQEKIADYGSRVRAYTSQKDMFLDPMVAPWNKIYRTELLQQNEIRFPEGLIYEDTSFCLKAISVIKKSAFVPERFVVHFFRGNSTMNKNKAQKVANIFKVLEDVILFYQQTGEIELYQKELEYEIVKILLCSSMMRIAKVPDRKMRKQFCQDTWEMIQKYFPLYKRNTYIQAKGMKNRYMRCVTRWNITFFCKMFSYKKDET